MNVVNDRVENFQEVEGISGMEHFSQTTLDLLRERTDGAYFLITGGRGGTGSRGGLFNHLKRLEQQLHAQRILVSLRYPPCPTAR